MNNTGQLALSVQLPDDETFSSYQRINQLTAANAEKTENVADLLKGFVDGYHKGKAEQNSFFLFGISGVGKSHLLHATCSYATELGLTSQCIALSEVSEYSSEILIGLEQIDIICIDDIQLIANKRDWERDIFDLFNRLMENNKCIVISGNDSVNALTLSLPDLVSRLSWGYTAQLKPLSDEEKCFALQYRAQQRGLILSDEASRFLVNHLSRNMTDLISSLDALDKASIKEQRKLTIPFIKDILINSRES